jgi:hypothetical protein
MSRSTFVPRSIERVATGRRPKPWSLGRVDDRSFRLDLTGGESAFRLHFWFGQTVRLDQRRVFGVLAIVLLPVFAIPILSHPLIF